MVHLRLPQPGTSIAPTAMTQPFPSSSLLFPFLHPVYLLCFMSLCVSFFYLIVCCFSVIWALLPMLEKDTCSAASINAIFSQYSQKHIFKTFACHTFPSPAISTPRFPPLHSGAAISTPAFSTPAFSASTIKDTHR